MRTEPELRSMIRRLEEYAANLELRAVLESKGGPREIDHCICRWAAVITAKDALVWAAGGCTDEALMALVEERLVER